MKRSLRLRLAALFMLLLVAASALTACSAKTDIGMADDLTEDFLDLLLADDYSAAYAMLQNTTELADFKPYWDAMRLSADGATAYEIEQIGWNISTKNGTTIRMAAFEVALNNGRILAVRTTLVDGIDGIGGLFFHDTTDFYATYGSLADVGNIVLILLSLLAIAFTVWMLVDCARRKMKKKPLWMIIILLSATVSVTFGQELGMRFGVALAFMLSSAVADPFLLSVTAKLMIPVGALVYFFLRKRLTVTAPIEQNAETDMM